MRRFFIWLTLIICTVWGAQATERPVLGVSQSAVEINTRFTGSKLLIFGAITNTGAGSGHLDVIITVEGPKLPVKVWKKARKFGIWQNDSYVEIDEAPQFYAIGTSAPLQYILSDTEDLRHKISIERAIRSVGAPQNIENSFDYTDALIHLREEAGLFVLAENSVTVQQGALFQTKIGMPATIAEGSYTLRVFLTRGREIISSLESEIEVRKIGLEERLFAFAVDAPLLYGVFAVVLAALAGWTAHGIFSLIRRQ